MTRCTLLSLFLLVALLGLPAPAAHAGCGDEPKPGVDWSDCEKPGIDLTEANLNGANLEGANLQSAILVQTDLSGARIERLDISFANADRTNFTGAKGIPNTEFTFFQNVTCPDGTPQQAACSWGPVAVTLAGFGAGAAPGSLPLLLVVAVAGLTAAVVGSRLRRKTAVS